ncbi:hypothetical protein VOLCADRAFT_86956 [Volvox carteri f. nagariensis]|uniref:Uncharacterized protein n=1 Tax=Volvox carteri f. nagariensis TaxID=3068 RepID=D8TKT8_VOLCA|nr:uncharacterized protein VOLCADRAFT_86956 [Volvox carteri f. nagariensis]EFJ51941.1 hypothetical protein VOLCADRAFT_86956 [Volvox carteri f. nagariensis]|eukprot:XP_002946715.1 hypothetical protein VOLCADRAFT_86956 [Volvox carteri f. nagariensis]
MKALSPIPTPRFDDATTDVRSTEQPVVFKLQLRPLEDPESFKPSVQLVSREFATRYLESVGVRPSKATMDLVNRNVPLTESNIKTTLRAKGHVEDEIHISVPSVTHRYRVPVVINPAAVLQLGIGNSVLGSAPDGQVDAEGGAGSSEALEDLFSGRPYDPTAAGRSPGGTDFLGMASKYLHPFNLDLSLARKNLSVLHAASRQRLSPGGGAEGGAGPDGALNGGPSTGGNSSGGGGRGVGGCTAGGLGGGSSFGASTSGRGIGGGASSGLLEGRGGGGGGLSSRSSFAASSSRRSGSWPHSNSGRLLEEGAGVGSAGGPLDPSRLELLEELAQPLLVTPEVVLTLQGQLEAALADWHRHQAPEALKGRLTTEEFNRTQEELSSEGMVKLLITLINFLHEELVRGHPSYPAQQQQQQHSNAARESSRTSGLAGERSSQMHSGGGSGDGGGGVVGLTSRRSHAGSVIFRSGTQLPATISIQQMTNLQKYDLGYQAYVRQKLEQRQAQGTAAGVAESSGGRSEGSGANPAGDRLAGSRPESPGHYGSAASSSLFGPLNLPSSRSRPNSSHPTTPGSANRSHRSASPNPSTATTNANVETSDPALPIPGLPPHVGRALRSSPSFALAAAANTARSIHASLDAADMAALQRERLFALHVDFANRFKVLRQKRSGMFFTLPILLLSMRLCINLLFSTLYPLWTRQSEGAEVLEQMDSLLCALFDPHGYLERALSLLQSTPSAIEAVTRHPQRRGNERRHFYDTSPLMQATLQGPKSSVHDAIMHIGINIGMLTLGNLSSRVCVRARKLMAATANQPQGLGLMRTQLTTEQRASLFQMGLQWMHQPDPVLSQNCEGIAGMRTWHRQLVAQHLARGLPEMVWAAGHFAALLAWPQRSSCLRSLWHSVLFQQLAGGSMKLGISDPGYAGKLWRKFSFTQAESSLLCCSNPALLSNIVATSGQDLEPVRLERLSSCRVASVVIPQPPWRQVAAAEGAGAGTGTGTAASCGAVGGMEAYELALRLVSSAGASGSASADGSTYTSVTQKVRVSVKIPDRSPEDLAPGWDTDLQINGQRRALVLFTYIRRGCIQLILDLLGPGAVVPALPGGTAQARTGDGATRPAAAIINGDETPLPRSEESATNTAGLFPGGNAVGLKPACPGSQLHLGSTVTDNSQILSVGAEDGSSVRELGGMSRPGNKLTEQQPCPGSLSGAVQPQAAPGGVHDLLLSTICRESLFAGRSLTLQVGATATMVQIQQVKPEDDGCAACGVRRNSRLQELAVTGPALPLPPDVRIWQQVVCTANTWSALSWDTWPLPWRRPQRRREVVLACTWGTGIEHKDSPAEGFLVEEPPRKAPELQLTVRQQGRFLPVGLVAAAGARGYGAERRSLRTALAAGNVVAAVDTALGGAVAAGSEGMATTQQCSPLPKADSIARHDASPYLLAFTLSNSNGLAHVELSRGGVHSATAACVLLVSSPTIAHELEQLQAAAGGGLGLDYAPRPSVFTDLIRDFGTLLDIVPALAGCEEGTVANSTADGVATCSQPLIEWSLAPLGDTGISVPVPTRVGFLRPRLHRCTDGGSAAARGLEGMQRGGAAPARAGTAGAGDLTDGGCVTAADVDDLEESLKRRALMLASVGCRVGLNLLHYFVSSGMAACAIRVLDILHHQLGVPAQLLAGSDCCHERMTLMHHAARSGSFQTIAAVVTWLEEHGIDPAWDSINPTGLTPLHLLVVAPDSQVLGTLVQLRWPGARRAWHGSTAGNCTPAQFAAMAREETPCWWQRAASSSAVLWLVGGAWCGLSRACACLVPKRLVRGLEGMVAPGFILPSLESAYAAWLHRRVVFTDLLFLALHTAYSVTQAVKGGWAFFTQHVAGLILLAVRLGLLALQWQLWDVLQRRLIWLGLCNRAIKAAKEGQDDASRRRGNASSGSFGRQGRGRLQVPREGAAVIMELVRMVLMLMIVAGVLPLPESWARLVQLRLDFIINIIMRPAAGQRVLFASPWPQMRVLPSVVASAIALVGEAAITTYILWQPGVWVAWSLALAVARGVVTHGYMPYQCQASSSAGGNASCNAKNFQYYERAISTGTHFLRGCKLTSSHHDFRIIDALPPHVRNTTLLIVNLREPASRAVSHFHMLRRHQDPGAINSTVIDYFLGNPMGVSISRNRMTRVLAGEFCCKDGAPVSYDNRELLERAVKRLDQFCVVGLTSRVQDTMLYVQHTLGLGTERTPKNLHYHNNAKKYTPVDDEVLQRLQEANALDVELYREAERRFGLQMKSISRDEAATAGESGDG